VQRSGRLQTPAGRRRGLLFCTLHSSNVLAVERLLLHAWLADCH